MARYPGAAWKPIGSHGGPLKANLGLVLHVTTNDFSPYGFFSRAANSASSTWWIGLDGAVEQYVDSGVQSWAQRDGNATYDSVETAGTADQPMTPAQVEALAKLYAWGHQVHGWALACAEIPGQRGLGWHGMGAAHGYDWGHAACPGIRRNQRPAVIARATQLLNPQEDDLTPDESRMLADLHRALVTPGDPKAWIYTNHYMPIKWGAGSLQSLGGDLAALNAKIDALAKAGGVDAATLEAVAETARKATLSALSDAANTAAK